MKTDSPQSSVRRLPEFEGLRGLLAVWVAFSHALCWAGTPGLLLPGFLAQWWSNFIYAQDAVDVFIILSGFAITTLLVDSRLSWGAFMLNRVFRIYPVYLICLGFGIAALGTETYVLAHAPWGGYNSYFSLVRPENISANRYPLYHLLAHLTLLFGLIPRFIMSNADTTFLPPAWSITLEWQFYIVAPVILSFIKDFRWVIILSAVAIFAPLFCQSFENPCNSFLLSKFSLFLVGIASFYLHKRLVDIHRNETISWLWFASCCAIGAFAPFSLFVWCVAFGAATRLFESSTPLFGQTVRNVLCNRMVSWLGSISYPLYLVHWPVLITFMGILVKLKLAKHSSTALLWLTFGAIPLSIMGAYLIHCAIEVPMMSVGKRLRKKLSEGVGIFNQNPG